MASADSRPNSDWTKFGKRRQSASWSAQSTPSSRSDDEEGRDISNEISAGGRFVRLMIHGWMPSEDRVWIDQQATFGDLSTELATIDSTGAFVVLQPKWGPKPCWSEATPESPVGRTCQVIHAIFSNQAVRCIMGIVRTSRSDYPIAIFESEVTSHRTFSQEIESYPDLAGKIKSITRYSDDNDVRDDPISYEELANYYSSTFSTTIVITIDQPTDEFKFNPSYKPVPTFIQSPFTRCTRLLKTSYDLKYFALQMIHLSHAIMHIIISLADQLEPIVNKDNPDIEAVIAADDDMADVLRIAPFLSRDIQGLLDLANETMDTIESGNFDRGKVQRGIRKVFDAICGEYPGAVTVRHSYKRFETLSLIDQEEEEAIRALNVPDIAYVTTTVSDVQTAASSEAKLTPETDRMITDARWIAEGVIEGGNHDNNIDLSYEEPVTAREGRIPTSMEVSASTPSGSGAWPTMGIYTVKMSQEEQTSSSKASLTDPKPKRQRTKAGCITCRVRGKKCDVDNGEICETCKRLRLHCLGFEDRRPDWLRTKENINIWRKRVREFLTSQALDKGHAYFGLRSGSVPDASLTLEDMRRDLDAWGVAPNPDSPSAPLQDHERDMEPEHPLGFGGGMPGHRDYTLPPLQNIARQGGNDGEDPQYLPKRFENAIGGIADEDNHNYRWVPPPPFTPMKRSYEDDVKYGLPPGGPLSSRPNLSGPPGYGLHPPLESPTSGRLDPRQDMRPPRPVHNASGSFSSGPDTNSGSHDTSSFPIPSSSAAESLPPVHHLLSAHDRDRSDQPHSGSTGGNSAAGSYSGHGSSNSRNVPVYSQAPPTMSPGHHAPYSHPEGVFGYSQQTRAPSYGPPTSDPGHSSGPGPDRRPLHARQQAHHGSSSQPLGQYNYSQYHPYYTSSHSYAGSFASQGSGHNESPPHAQLSIRTSSIPGPTPITSAHFPHQSVQSTSSSSPDTYSAYGSYPMPSTATSFNSYASPRMSITSLLQASTVGTPASIPPSSGISTTVPTPTTAHQGGDQNPRETNTAVMAMTYFQGYPSTNAEYNGTQEAVFQPLPIQANPTMTRDFYLDIYFNHVIGFQYRLANLQTLPRQMSDLSECSPAVRMSISLLSLLYLEAQQLAQSGVAGTLMGVIDATGRGSFLGASDPYSNPQFPLLDLGVPGYGFINSSSLLPSNSTNFRAEYDLLYARVKKLLAEAKVAKGERYDQGDAMACLHVISAFLFSGGRGDWDQFLQIAGQWVSGCVSDYAGDVAGALRDMDSMGRFIFRTTMWMDVFGSISLCRSPRFIELYRTLFSPGALDILAESSIETNMDRVMGCPNEVILAFAEIAHLEAKTEHLARQPKDGLPMHPILGFVPFVADPRSRWQQAMASLEDEGRSIERLIPEALGPAALPMNRFVEVHSAPAPNSFRGTIDIQSQNLEYGGTDLNLFGKGRDGGSNTFKGFWSNMDNTMQPGSSTSGVSANPVPVSELKLGGYVDPDEDKRGKIADVFRNAARVYLHSVISGCDPLVPTIRRAVQATIRALEILGASPLDRSLIFPLMIAGCLAATRDEVAFCIGRLSLVGKDAESLGNCFATRLLIESVWQKRVDRGFDGNNGVAEELAVSWRDVMMEMNQNPLLLV